MRSSAPQEPQEAISLQKNRALPYIALTSFFWASLVSHQISVNIQSRKRRSGKTQADLGQQNKKK